MWTRLVRRGSVPAAETRFVGTATQVLDDASQKPDSTTRIHTATTAEGRSAYQGRPPLHA